MRNIYFLLITLFTVHLSFAQTPAVDQIKRVGDFLQIDLGAETHFDALEVDKVDKLLLKKDAILSVVIYQKQAGSKWKGYELLGYQVIITTAENRMVRTSDGMTNVSKTYVIAFKEASAADVFAEKLVRLCN